MHWLPFEGSSKLKVLFSEFQRGNKALAEISIFKLRSFCNVMWMTEDYFLTLSDLPIENRKKCFATQYQFLSIFSLNLPLYWLVAKTSLQKYIKSCSFFAESNESATENDRQSEWIEMFTRYKCTSINVQISTLLHLILSLWLSSTKQIVLIYLYMSKVVQTLPDWQVLYVIVCFERLRQKHLASCKTYYRTKQSKTVATSSLL